MDDIEKKLLGIHEQRETLDAIETNAIEELVKCQDMLIDMRNSLATLTSLIAETTAINARFLEMTGEDDDKTKEMLADAEHHFNLLNEKIVGYEKLQSDLMKSLQNSAELQAKLIGMRDSIVN